MTALPYSFRSPTPPSAPAVRRVLVVHADTEFAARLTSSLSDGGIASRTSRTRAESLAAFEELAPDVVLVDLALADACGIAFIREISARRPTLPIVVLTTERDEARILSAIRAGATGYVFQGEVESRVVTIVEEALRGGAPLSRPVARLLLQAFRGAELRPQGQPELTPRERTVLGMLSEGKSYAEVGTTLGVSENTVRSHVRSIYDKLGVSSKTEAVMAALRFGLLRVG